MPLTTKYIFSIPLLVQDLVYAFIIIFIINMYYIYGEVVNIMHLKKVTIMEKDCWNIWCNSLFQVFPCLPLRLKLGHAMIP